MKPEINRGYVGRATKHLGRAIVQTAFAAGMLTVASDHQEASRITSSSIVSPYSSRSITAAEIKLEKTLKQDEGAMLAGVEYFVTGEEEYAYLEQQIRLEAELAKRVSEEQAAKKIAVPDNGGVTAASVGNYSRNSGKIRVEVVDIPDVMTVLFDCESGDGQVGPPFYVQWDYDGSSGFDGGPQFHPDTWRKLDAAKGYDFAWQAPPEIQRAAAWELQEEGGWGHWGSCTDRMRAEGYLSD